MLKPIEKLPAPSKGAQFEQLVADEFRSSGWKVKRDSSHGSELVLSRGKQIYVAEIKAMTEARRDRAVPLLAQVILQVQTAAGSAKPAATPLAIVAAQRVPESLAMELHNYAAHYAPGVAVGVIDLEGFRSFKGLGLEALNAPRSKGTQRIPSYHVSSPQLFSDLNQWMLKVLLAPAIPESYLGAPRREFKNASQLAESAGVTVMSAFRLVRSLKDEGFLDESSGVLRLVRIPELLRRWQASNVRPVRDVSLRWIMAGGKEQLEKALRSYHTKSLSPSRGLALTRPRTCLGLFAAADALGMGFVQGVPPTIYLEKADPGVIRKFGLSPELSGESAEVFVRIPRFAEAVFRARVVRYGVPVCDALQVWLDVSNHPARGKEQAEQLKKGILAGLFAGDY